MGTSPNFIQASALDEFLGNYDPGTGMEGPVRVPAANIAAQFETINGLTSGVISIVDKDLSAPPGSPTTGARYIVGAAATGAWATHEEDIAQWSGTEWTFTDPTGATAYLEDEQAVYHYTSGTWTKIWDAVTVAAVAASAAAAATSETNAETAETGAVAAQAGAEAAQTAAETARDAAFVNADVYADIATGLAAVAEGEQFQVVEGDEIARYKDVSGSEVEVARYPSAQAVGKAPSRSLGTIEDAATAGAGALRYVTDGDTGSTPCLGVSTGAIWSKISLGAEIVPLRADTRALIARMTTPPSSAIAAVYDQFFQDLDDAAVLGLIEDFTLYAAHDAQAATLNWMSTSHTATLPVAPTWTAFRGYATDGVSQYINSNLTPSALSLSGQDDATMIGWVNAQKQRPIIGGTGGANQSNLWASSDSALYVGLNHSTVGSDAMSGLSDTLHYLAISRTGAAVQKAYHRLGATSTFTRASNGRPNVPVFVGARNNGGSPSTYGAAEYACFAYARGMDDSQHAAFKAALKSLMRGIGNYQEPLICWGDSRTAGGGGPTIWHTQITTASSDRRVAFNGGVSGERSLEIRNRMVANTVNTDGVHVIWAGYNGGGTAGSPIYRADAGFFAAVTGDIAAMVVDAQAKSGRYLVLTLPRSNMAAQYVGTTEGDALGAVNASILSTYGTKAVDVSTLLQTNGTTDPNGCIHADYVIDMVTDPIHLNTLGNTVVKDAVIAAIAANGWL